MSECETALTYNIERMAESGLVPLWDSRLHGISSLSRAMQIKDEYKGRARGYKIDYRIIEVVQITMETEVSP